MAKRKSKAHDRRARRRLQRNAKEKRWLRLEKLAEQIYRELQPDAVVTHDDKIMGKSGVKRQIDVSIRANVAGHDLLIIVQAKDHKRKVDITRVGEFSSVITDVGASKGVMICNSGFTDGAFKQAKSLGIDLCNAFDAESRAWGSDLRIPVLVRISSLDTRVRGQFEERNRGTLPKDFRDWEFEGDGKQIDLLSTFVRSWNDGQADRTENVWHSVPIGVERCKVRMEFAGREPSHEWINVGELSLVYKVELKWYLKYCEPEEYRGLKNLSSDRLEVSRLRVGMPLPIDLREWQIVQSKDELGISKGDPVFLIVTQFGKLDLSKSEFSVTFAESSLPPLE